MISNKNKKIGDPFYKSKTWRDLRLLILKRDNYTCTACKQRFESRDLQVDHILPRLSAPHLAYHPQNLRTLCRRCHTRCSTSMGRNENYKERPFVDSSGFPSGSEWSK